MKTDVHGQSATTQSGQSDPPGLPLSVLITLWTILIAGFAGWGSYQIYKAEYTGAVAVAINNFNKDVLYRRWASMHGGVYVPVTPETPPSPYLSNIPDRDITLPSGKILTLINPAYMTRQVHELGDTQYGVRGHITSLKPLRPQNAPDEWEKSAMLQFEKGMKELFSIEPVDGKPFMRYMRPLRVEAPCLKCHAHQGYKTGDVRGGISVSIPWTPHKERLLAQIPLFLASHLGIWILGTVGIVVSRRRLQKVLLTQKQLIEEAHSREHELRQFSRAIDQCPVTIVITDTKGTIEFVNPHFTQLTGYSFEESIGQNPRVLNSGKNPPELFKDLWKTVASGNTWEGDILNKSKDGVLFWERATISAMRDDSGAITHYLAVKEDITEKKNIMEQLIAAKDKAEAATQAKSFFLAIMSHEIRTPMNGVIGMTNLLLDTDLNQEQRQFAEIVSKSGENLMGLINDILDFSKIEAGKLDIEILDFDIRTTLEDTTDLLAIRAANTGLELICRIDPEVPSYLKGDPGRLRQIIINLAGNSLKFTQKGEVVISAKLESDKDGFVTILFEIHDTGIGIPSARLDAVFAPFTQVDGSTTRKFGGTGLGLAICKQLAELMGGEIGVSSVEGKGSTFWFTARFEKQAPEDLKTSEVLMDITGTHILVVDDNETNRLLMTTLLNYWGCRYEAAADAESALALLLEAAGRGDPFKIALLDQEMPVMDGLELGRRIKADPLMASTLMVMVTSLAKRGDAATLEQIGFSGYLAKPVRQSHLYDCIALVLGRTKRPTDVSKNTEGSKGIVTRHTVAEQAKNRVRILLAEDNIINQKVAQSMLNKLGYKADVVADGQEAVRALEMIDYNLVFMDCQMPQMDGFEATGVIRDPGSNVMNHKVPIIAMTANAMKEDREKCIEAGMDDYLSKPVKKEALAEVLGKWLKEKGEV